MSQREDLGRVCEDDRTLSDTVKDGIDVNEHCYDPCSDGRILDEVRHTWGSVAVLEEGHGMTYRQQTEPKPYWGT
jgi:hypothetical protein